MTLSILTYVLSGYILSNFKPSVERGLKLLANRPTNIRALQSRNMLLIFGLYELEDLPSYLRIFVFYCQPDMSTYNFDSVVKGLYEKYRKLRLF